MRYQPIHTCLFFLFSSFCFAQPLPFYASFADLVGDDFCVPGSLYMDNLESENEWTVLPYRSKGLYVHSLPAIRYVAPVAATPRGGSFTEPPLITLATTGKNSLIRYTTDGSAPDQSSSVYDGPILIDGNTTLRIQAFGPTNEVSEVKTEVYRVAEASSTSETQVQLNLSPNETNTGFTINATGDYYDVVDDRGRLIEQHLLAWTTTEVAYTGWEPGIYYVRIYGASGQVTAQGRVVR